MPIVSYVDKGSNVAIPQIGHTHILVYCRRFGWHNRALSNQYVSIQQAPGIAAHRCKLVFCGTLAQAVNKRKCECVKAKKHKQSELCHLSPALYTSEATATVCTGDETSITNYATQCAVSVGHCRVRNQKKKPRLHCKDLSQGFFDRKVFDRKVQHKILFLPLRQSSRCYVLGLN